MTSWLRRLQPFQTPDTRRLAVLFAIVYFSQGMYSLPDQTIAMTFKDQALTADRVAIFFLIASVPWFIKPVYGFLSDFLPLFGRRRKSYLLMTSALACAMGVVAAQSPDRSYWYLAGLYTAMGLGLAFTDVLTDALMVENGKRHDLTGAFQSAQWASITVATVLVGVLGGHYAAHRDLHAAFIVAAGFPMIVFVMTIWFVHDPPVQSDRAAFRAAWAGVREGLGERSLWVVAGFILLFNFSPSFGPAFLYYQTDVLGFGQEFIGGLASINAIAAVGGAVLYAPMSRRIPLRRLINLAIGMSVLATLAYLLYRGRGSAVVVQIFWGTTGMITELAFLDLAAKACPRRAEATFFASLMAVFNLGTQASQTFGAHLYTIFGEGAPAYRQLVLISAGATAVVWLLVPLLRIEQIEARAHGAGNIPAN